MVFYTICVWMNINWSPVINGITKKVLLYGMGNYIQYFVVIYNGRECKKWYILICTCTIESFFCIPETNTALLINYILIQILRIKNNF